ncbi:MAG: DMT family transporter [Marinobacterium sp.]|nr:DMT family transporter [Marinobacterium sp.]
MFNALLYLCVLTAWGGSWLAIKWQLGDIPALVSILYRFLLAALIMLPLLLLSRQRQATNMRDQLFCLLQGCCLFSLNFVAFYQATHYIASGLVAVVMSTATVFNALHSQLIWQQQASKRFYQATALGVSGLLLLFWQELQQWQWSSGSVKGIGLALLGTWLFSLGNMVGVRHSKNGLKPFTSSCWAMLYGCMVLLLLIIFINPEHSSMTSILTATRNASEQYIGALLYLAVVATVVGFTTYLLLVSRIGASSAAYALVITPVIALTLSSLFENYSWTLPALLGLITISAGNIVLLRPENRTVSLKQQMVKSWRAIKTDTAQ